MVLRQKQQSKELFIVLSEGGHHVYQCVCREHVHIGMRALWIVHQQTVSKGKKKEKT